MKYEIFVREARISSFKGRKKKKILQIKLKRCSSSSEWSKFSKIYKYTNYKEYTKIFFIQKNIQIIKNIQIVKKKHDFFARGVDRKKKGIKEMLGDEFAESYLILAG